MPTFDSIPFIPGFSKDQVQGLIAQIQDIIRTEMGQLRNEFRQQPSQILPSVEHPQSRPITQPVTQPVIQPAIQPATQPATQPVTQPAAQSTPQPITQSKQEEEPLQAITENTAEKPSGNKATIVKNMAQLSTIPRQIITQQAENTTTIWPTVSTCLGNITLWYITAMSTQEKDLLRRSQPIGPLQEEHQTV
ncbi:hypothetical protein HO173_000995 [Letharia columbiana]|uniref:Uncharacterized protein n=1 Tax=Letharia columbiana TaxID=112416 RepID=A0A8H6G6B9_9LECA|nr:uncharacterized protein HO173_000995 [Letharia columbiana]KAF6241201.1 hypothetical protein HO173_000995 [Letharia columbiana]